jgi:hypothetical protein
MFRDELPVARSVCLLLVLCAVMAATTARSGLVGILTDLQIDAGGKHIGFAVVEAVGPAAHAAGRPVSAA